MKKILVTGFCLLMLSSCTTEKTLYSWYNYQETSYQYNKKQTPEAAEKLLANYKLIIEKQKATRKTVPPGICAENGYMLLKAGKAEEGITLLKKEAELYPESKTFIDRIIQQTEK